MVNLDKLWEIADRYNTSKPVSGNWDTETEHELNAISKELGISKQEAKQLMIKELGFDDSMFNGINCSLDKVEPVTPPRSIPHELPPHNNEPVKQEKKIDKNGKSFKDYLDEAKKNVNSSRKITSSYQTAINELEEYFERSGSGNDDEYTIYTRTLSRDDENHIAKICEDNDCDFAIGTSHVTIYPIESSRKITSGLDPYLCCPNCGEPELFENIKEHNIKCYNCGNTISYDELKNLKKYVSPHSKITSGLDKETLIEKINEVEPDDYSDWSVEELQELAINLGISIESSRRPVKSGVPGYPDDYIPNKIYYIVVNGSKEYFMNENKARSVAYDLKFESPNVSGPYEETDPEEIAEVIDAGIIRSSRRPVKSARYIATDPESGEVLGSADTYEEAINEWGEDVTITDSEASEGQGEENMGLFSSIDELDNNYITEGMRVTWGEKGKGKVIMWDGNDVLVQGITSTGDDYFIVGYDFKLTGNAKEPHLTWMYGDYDAGDDKEQAIQYFENRREDLKSSKTPNGDKAFLSNIVSSVSTNNMTEEQAIKRIALRNNCNEGFARNILSEALKDETLIQSGVMEIADDINKEFDIDGNIDSWLKAYMKDEGKSNTVGGEILRAFAKIRYRYYNDGDMIGRGYGKETVNPAARYLLDKMTDSSTQDIEEMLDGESDINRSDDTYEDWLEGFEGSLENYLRNNEELFHTPNKEDMLDYRTEEDVDSSVTECYVEDSEGNTYWFENEGGDGDWKCYQIDPGSDKEFEVGDVVDSSQLEQYVDFADEDDYLDFDLNGLSYSAERTDGDSWEITNIDVDGGVASEGDYWSVDDLMRYGPYDSNGNELSENDLY